MQVGVDFTVTFLQAQLRHLSRSRTRTEQKSLSANQDTACQESGAIPFGILACLAEYGVTNPYVVWRMSCEVWVDVDACFPGPCCTRMPPASVKASSVPAVPLFARSFADSKVNATTR
jgi:hypothetical protein